MWPRVTVTVEVARAQASAGPPTSHGHEEHHACRSMADTERGTLDLVRGKTVHLGNRVHRPLPGCAPLSFGAEARALRLRRPPSRQVVQAAMVPSVVWGRKRNLEPRLTTSFRPIESLLLSQQRYLVHRMTGQLGTLCRGLSEGSQIPSRAAALWVASLDARGVFRVERNPTAIISDPPERNYPRPFGELSPRRRCALEHFTPVVPLRGRKETGT